MIGCVLYVFGLWFCLLVCLVPRLSVVGRRGWVGQEQDPRARARTKARSKARAKTKAKARTQARTNAKARTKTKARAKAWTGPYDQGNRA